MTRRRRLLDLLRRPGPEGAGDGRAPDDASVVAAQSRTHELVKEAVQSTERLAGIANRHRVAVDALPEVLRGLDAQLVDAASALARVDQAQTRLGVLALNTGLEGAKLEGTAGRAVLMVAEELRTLTTRAAGATKDLSQALSEIRAQAKLGETRALEARAGSTSIVEEAGLALVAFHAADEAVAALGAELTRATGLEPEVALALQNAEKHARELLASLAIVARSSPVAVSALRPILDPLVLVVDRLRRSGGEESE